MLVWGTEPVPSVIDTQPPTAPTNLASPSQTSTTIALTWTASTDNVGVTGYRIFRGASVAGTSATTSFTADGLTPSTSYTFTVAAFDAAGNVSPASAARSASTTARPTVDAYTQRFLDLYADLHGNNGYFHPSGIPYHSVETLMVEAPDHGHETTSETYSYWAWLEVMNGRITGDWTPLQRMFDSMEANIIPTAADQPTNSFYNPADPADYAPEADLPSGYPSPISSTVPVGSDPIGAALRTTYGADVYGMHWILDVDNFYRYGRRGDGTSQPSYINTFQRGPQESTWETVPHPSWEDFQWGAGLAGGFLPLFISGPAPAQQWRYTNAPDADARLIQAMYWANQFSPGHPTVVSLSAKAAQMGDFLRYGMFDKYFKTMGCASPQCPAGTGYNAAHYLMSWYYAWGGPIPPNGGWSFRIGSSHNHFGYQNPMAALGSDNGAGVASALRRTGHDRLDDEPRPPAAVLPVAAVGRRRHRRRRHQQLGRRATRRRPPGSRRSTGCSIRRTPSISIRAATPGSGSRPGRWSAWRSSTSKRTTLRPSSSSTSGSPGPWARRG